MLENVSADECAYVRFGFKADMTASLIDVGIRSPRQELQGLPSGYFISSSAKNGRAMIRLKRMNDTTLSVMRFPRIWSA